MGCFFAILGWEMFILCAPAQLQQLNLKARALSVSESCSPPLLVRNLQHIWYLIQSYLSDHGDMSQNHLWRTCLLTLPKCLTPSYCFVFCFQNYIYLLGKVFPNLDALCLSNTVSHYIFMVSFGFGECSTL